MCCRAPASWAAVSGLDEEKLKSSNALDFDDLIVRTLELFANHPPVLEAYQRRFRFFFF